MYIVHDRCSWATATPCAGHKPTTTIMWQTGLDKDKMPNASSRTCWKPFSASLARLGQDILGLMWGTSALRIQLVQFPMSVWKREDEMHQTKKNLSSQALSDAILNYSQGLAIFQRLHKLYVRLVCGDVNHPITDKYKT